MLTSKEFVVQCAFKKRLVVCQCAVVLVLVQSTRHAEAWGPANAIPLRLVILWGGHGTGIRLGGGRNGRRLYGTGLGGRR